MSRCRRNTLTFNDVQCRGSVFSLSTHTIRRLTYESEKRSASSVAGLEIESSFYGL